MELTKRIERKNPNRERFKVSPAFDPDGIVDVSDNETGLVYTVFETKVIKDGRKGVLSVLPDGCDNDESWDFKSADDLVVGLFSEIQEDADYLIEND